ncbi:MAG: hypothetical protein ACRDOL_37820, partial [Streptosporangiaceae bacterium]
MHPPNLVGTAWVRYPAVVPVHLAAGRARLRSAAVPERSSRPAPERSSRPAPERSSRPAPERSCCSALERSCCSAL